MGQRKGLGIATGERLYVVEIRSENNEVVLGEDEELWTRHIIARDFNYVSIDNLCDEINVIAKIRYNHRGAKAILRKLDDLHVECIFEEPQRAPTPGQALVCYQDDYVIGGGTIIRR